MDEQVFEVEEIVSKRLKKGKTEYFIKWEGYSKRYNSWVAAENLDCSEILAKFEERNKNNSESIKTSSGTSRRRTTRKSNNTGANIKGASSACKSRGVSNKTLNAPNMTRSIKSSSGKRNPVKRNLLREKNGDVRKSILNASGNDKNEMESCAVSTSKNSLVQRKRPKENERDYDALTEIESRSVSDDANSSDLSELTDLASIVDAVELTRTVKNSSNGENGRELSKSNVHNKKRAREHDLELENIFQNRENIKGASTVRKIKNKESIAHSSSSNKINKTTTDSANHVIAELQKYTQKGLEMQKGTTEVVSTSVRFSECDLNKMTFNEVTKNFADGLLHAKYIATPRENNFELYNKIRRLRTTLSNKSLNWFFCTECGRVLYFNTNSHYNQLTRHKSNDCVPQFTGQDKIYMSRNNFIEIVESAMKIGSQNGPTSVPDAAIPDKWTKNNTTQFLKHLKTTNTIVQEIFEDEEEEFMGDEEEEVFEE